MSTKFKGKAALNAGSDDKVIHGASIPVYGNE